FLAVVAAEAAVGATASEAEFNADAAEESIVVVKLAPRAEATSLAFLAFLTVLSLAFSGLLRKNTDYPPEVVVLTAYLALSLAARPPGHRNRQGVSQWARGTVGG
ncbi:MAG: hypothetical protein WBG36_10740, partial [Ornithinimicrobium sp.]